MTVPDEAAPNTHWLIFRDESGWGCKGCDWVGKTLHDFWTVHEKETNDISF